MINASPHRNSSNAKLQKNIVMREPNFVDHKLTYTGVEMSYMPISLIFSLQHSLQSYMVVDILFTQISVLTCTLMDLRDPGYHGIKTSQKIIYYCRFNRCSTQTCNHNSCTRSPYIRRHASKFYNIGEHHYDKIIKRRTLLLETDREMARNN